MKKILLFILVCLSVFILINQFSFAKGENMANEQVVFNCNKEEVPQLVISRTAKIEAEADKAIIYIQVVTEETKVDRASTKNKEKMNLISDILKEYQVEKKDIKTTNYNVEPLYEGKPLFSSVSRPTSYRVTNAISVNFYKLDDLGKILTRISDIENVNIYNVNFASTKIEDLKKEAVKKAAAIARVTAVELADVAGGKLGKVLRIEEYAPSVRQVRPVEMAKAMMVPAPAERATKEVVIEVGTLEVEGTCTITYQIDQK